MNFIITKVSFSITICSWERTNSTTYGDGEALNTIMKFIKFR
ncbi:hypothetical protein [Oceanobacillus alkalisoli]|nr:hypothetical protein [Oceanobacillus alkalisoli]